MIVIFFFKNIIAIKVLTFTMSCSTDEVVLNHEIYLELYICFSCQESFIHFINALQCEKLSEIVPPLALLSKKIN